ncbi:MAG: substrate-binding domain-containing protein [Verrucomicrobiales bacterium]|nr:substrate-binding domain-containing protein [Verrucomicrobiales bacterium]
MKRIAQLLGLTALSLAFIGCSPNAEKPEGNGGDGGNADAATPADTTGDGADANTTKTKGLIAYSPLTLSNPFFKVIGDHIKAEAEKHGYETLMVDPDMDVKKQSDQMEDFISRGVTAIILVPCDRLSIGPSVKAANEKGIPVFTVDAKCAAEGVEIAGHVGTDNFQGGKLAGEAMIKALGENGGKVLVLDFKKANSCVLRVNGFKEVINAHNEGRTAGKIEIVAELDGNGARTEGYQSTADALQSHDDLAAVFAINDPSALGAYTAIEEAKRQDQIKIIGFDGQLDGKQAIKDGKIFADPIQHPDKMGQQIVQNIVKYQAGEEFDKETLIPATIYDKAAADADPELK